MGQIAHLWITVALGFPFRTLSTSPTGINGSSTSRTNRQSFHTERRISPTWCVSITQTHLAPREGNNPCEPPHPYLSVPSSALCCLWPPAPGRQSDIFNSFYLFITLAPSCSTFPCTFLQRCWVHSKRQPQLTEMPKAISSPVMFWPPKDPILRRGLLWECSETQTNRDVTTLGELPCTWAKQGTSPPLSTSQNQVRKKGRNRLPCPRWNHPQGFWSPWKFGYWAMHKDLGTTVSFFPAFGKNLLTGIIYFSKFNFFPFQVSHTDHQSGAG